MKLSIIVILIFSVCLQSLNAQNSTEIWDQFDSVSVNCVEMSDMGLENRPFHYSTMLGTSIGFMPGVGAATHIYAAPQLNYQANSRLVLSAGVMAMESITNLPHLQSEFNYPSSISTLSVYFSATYQLSENLFIHGSGVKGMINPFVQDEMVNNSYNDLSFGATYKIGNFSFGASFHTTDRAGLYGSPFGDGMYGSPLIF